MEDTDLKEIYDESVVSKEGSFVSYLLVAVYAPIGLALVALRLLLSFLSSILASLSPALKSNSHFVNMYANLMGVYVQHDYSHPVSSSNRRLLIVSNHRSELDLLAVKSSLTECSYLNETASQLSGLASMLLTPVWQNQTNSSSQAIDFFGNVKNYPVVVFPEQLPTKSRLLLKFDSAAFAPRFEAAANDSEETTEQSNNNKLLLQPLVIELQRPILPLSLNHSSRIISTLLVLFSPVNVYRLTYLQPQVNGDECRQAIATKLGARLCQFSHEDVRKALIAKSQRANRVNRSNNAAQSTSSPSRSKMSFTDTSKLALQIKHNCV